MMERADSTRQIALEPDELEPLFRDVLDNIDLMLQHELIHGDLSAYNLLYWQGNVTLIDYILGIPAFFRLVSQRLFQ